MTPAAWGIPTASQRGAESEVAHKWARWLHTPCRLRGPHRFRAGGGIRSGSNQKRKILFFGGRPTKREFQSGATISEIAYSWVQWQSELGPWGPIDTARPLGMPKTNGILTSRWNMMIAKKEPTHVVMW